MVACAGMNDNQAETGFNHAGHVLTVLVGS